MMRNRYVIMPPTVIVVNSFKGALVLRRMEVGTWFLQPKNVNHTYLVFATQCVDHFSDKPPKHP